MIKKRNNLPNFLLIGAARSGTTSIYYYLKQHPEIYMSPIKEPKFFTSQFVQFPLRGKDDNLLKKRMVRKFDNYQKLFQAASREKAIGEASPDNLYYYEKVIPKIKKYLKNPKIIIVLRSPVARTYSAYKFLRRANRENLTFEKALKEEDKKNNNWEFIWFYKKTSLYYKQVKAFLENFTRVKVCLFKDLQENPRNFMKEIYNFLDVDSSFVPNVSVKYNISGIPKNNAVNQLLFQDNALKRFLKFFASLMFSQDFSNKIGQNLKNKNLQKNKMNEKTRKYLKKYFKKDINKLQKIIKKDINFWLAP